MPGVEVPALDAIVEKHPIALPIEPVGQQHPSLGARRHIGQVDRRHHSVSQAEVELIGMGLGEGVRLPRGHTPIITHAGSPTRHRRYTRHPVKTTFEVLEGNKVKLSVEVDETDFARDIDAAFTKIAQEVRLPGFRAGKAPRKVIEARIGVAAAREQALRDGVPMYLALSLIHI